MGEEMFFMTEMLPVWGRNVPGNLHFTNLSGSISVLMLSVVVLHYYKSKALTHFLLRMDLQTCATPIVEGVFTIWKT